MPKQKNAKIGEQVEEKKKISFFRRYFWTGTILLLLIIIGGIVFFIYSFNKPVSGIAAVVKDPKVTNIEDAPFERFEAKYLSFRHAASFSEKSHQTEPDAAGIVLESALFSENKANSNKIALTVESLKDRTMEDSGNYNLRASQPKQYEKKKFSFSGLEGVSFESGKDGLYEQTFFIPKNGYLVEMAFTTPISDDEKWNAEIKDVLASIQWKK